MKKLILGAFSLLLTISADAEVKLAKVFTNNMVLQQQKTLRVWGTADTGEKVTVRVGKQTAKAVADSLGKWYVELAPMKASAKEVRFVVNGKSNKITLDNVLIGEVWLAGGQSNMEYSMADHPKYCKPKKGDPNRLQKEYESANNPMIRIMHVRKELKTDTLPSVGWQMIDRQSLKPFSAPAYFFAKSLQDSLKVPVGIIHSSWGGTSIETWTPVEDYRHSSAFAKQMKGDKLTTTGETVGNRYKKMIEPMAPFAIRGFLWYQGESNLIMGDYGIYTEKMKLLVNGWRKAFADQSLAFYYAQISPYLYSARKTDADPKTWQDLARFWEAQTHCLDVIPNTGMIVTTDIPEDLRDIHPSYKWTVGERLALQALNKTYGRTDLVCDGPMVNTVTLTDEHVVIDFNNADGGLMTRDGKAADWFTVRTKWNRYVKTNVELKGNKAYIKRKDLSNPIEVRFGWDETAQPNLVNGAGLPAVPFRWIITPPVKNVKK